MTNLSTNVSQYFSLSPPQHLKILLSYISMELSSIFLPYRNSLKYSLHCLFNSIWHNFSVTTLNEFISPLLNDSLAWKKTDSSFSFCALKIRKTIHSHGFPLFLKQRPSRTHFKTLKIVGKYT